MQRKVLNSVQGERRTRRKIPKVPGNTTQSIRGLGDSTESPHRDKYSRIGIKYFCVCVLRMIIISVLSVTESKN